ncbi:hypothetical protein B4915_11680 [Leucobacter massiliensis]|uniref:Uncharacterized protein n=1 Tax=Leucobacter massiliensis TaxID=1686285 RepID=A0A2S9QLG4_9MICO|nr:hypothetical protein B4915_11680 [Leucobacter massiliensis]
MVLQIAPDTPSRIRLFWSVAVAVQLLFTLSKEITEQHPTLKPRRMLHPSQVGRQRACAPGSGDVLVHAVKHLGQGFVLGVVFEDPGDLIHCRAVVLCCWERRRCRRPVVAGHRADDEPELTFSVDSARLVHARGHPVVRLRRATREQLTVYRIIGIQHSNIWVGRVEHRLQLFAFLSVQWHHTQPGVAAVDEPAEGVDDGEIGRCPSTGELLRQIRGARPTPTERLSKHVVSAQSRRDEFTAPLRVIPPVLHIVVLALIRRSDRDQIVVLDRLRRQRFSLQHVDHGISHPLRSHDLRLLLMGLFKVFQPLQQLGQTSCRIRQLQTGLALLLMRILKPVNVSATIRQHERIMTRFWWEHARHDLRNPGPFERLPPSTRIMLWMLAQ